MAAATLPTSAGVREMTGVGPKLAASLAGLGVASVGDLLAHTPTRYLAVGEVRPVSAWPAGGHARIQVGIARARTRRGGRMMITEASGTDTEGAAVRLVWFGQRWLAKQLPGRTVVCEGVISAGATLRMEVRTHAFADEMSDAEHAGGPRPVYPAADGLSQGRLRALIGQALERAQIADPLPAPIAARLRLMSRAQAYEAVHRPADVDAARAGRRRLAFDELLAGQLVLRLVRERDARVGAPSLSAGMESAAALAAGLPFALSAGQERLWRRLAPALSASRPMRSLVQGEVGSGKTVIAALSLAAAAGAGRLGVMLCPTELLARQHHESLRRMLAAAGVEAVFVSGSLGAAERRRAIAQLEEAGTARVAVGTHALLGALGPEARSRLGLVAVDEQHRFGVAQRHALADQAAAAGTGVHLLQLTATPIPRSLALTAFGDMEVHDLPARRDVTRRVETRIVGAEQVGPEVREAAAAGTGVFVVAPRIGDEDADDAVLSRRLREETLAGLSVEVVHGRMGVDERQAAVGRFADGTAEVLVATTVIEVGIDVPQEGLMVILGAEAFGLAQLHQLRGRVGRAGQEAACLLVPGPDATEQAIGRLEALVDCDDGLELARRDLALRGAGQLHGDQQAGAAGMRVARLERDGRTLAEARYTARLILRADPALSHPAHAGLRAEVAAGLADLIRIARG